MDELKTLIIEALTHNPDHPGFKTKSAHYEFEDVKPSARAVGDKFGEEHKHLSKLHYPYFDRYSRGDPIQSAIMHYTGTESSEINTHLINAGTKRAAQFRATDENIKHIKTLNDHIDASAPLEREHHVYSGLGAGFDVARAFRIGKGIIQTKAFTSASIHPQVAAAFSSKESYNNGDQHIIHFHLPVGYNKGVYLGDRSELPNEKEMLLKPGQKWKLTGQSHVEIPYHDYDYTVGKTVKKKLKRHIWTVVPHEE